MLVVCRGFRNPVEGGLPSFDFGDDLFGGLVPDDWFRVVVPVFGPQFDGIDELIGAGEADAEKQGPKTVRDLLARGMDAE